MRKRPYVDEFLHWAGRNFEVVIFTASLPEYADPVIDRLDKRGVIQARLYRHHCTNREGDNIKDLSRIGRSPRDIILVDNAPVSYLLLGVEENTIGFFFFFDLFLYLSLSH